MELRLNEISPLSAWIDEAAEDGSVFEETVETCHATPDTVVLARKCNPVVLASPRCKARASEMERRECLVSREFPCRQRKIKSGNLRAAFVKFKAENIVLEY